MKRHALIILLVLMAVGRAVPAAAPVEQAASPKLAVAAFLRAMLTGDEEQALQRLAFASDETGKDAKVMLGRLTATARLRRALVQKFDARAQESSVGSREEQDVTDMLNLLSAAVLKVTGDRAELTFDNGRTFRLVQRAGTWKIDYDASQKAMGGLPAKEEVAAAAKRTSGIEQLTIDVSRGTVTLPEAERRFNAIIAPPQSAPAPVAPR